MIMQEKQILARAIGIQKEIGGEGRRLEIIKQRLFKKAVKCKAMYAVFFPN